MPQPYKIPVFCPYCLKKTINVLSYDRPGIGRLDRSYQCLNCGGYFLTKEVVYKLEEERKSYVDLS